jgi:hypothetical protein
MVLVAVAVVIVTVLVVVLVVSHVSRSTREVRRARECCGAVYTGKPLARIPKGLSAGGGEHTIEPVATPRLAYAVRPTAHPYTAPGILA